MLHMSMSSLMLIVVAASSTALQLFPYVDEICSRTTSNSEEDLGRSKSLHKKRTGGAQKKLGTIRPQRLHRLLPEGDSYGEWHLMLQARRVDVPGNSIAALLIVCVFLCVTVCLFVGRMRVKPTVPLKKKTWLFVCWICLWPALRPRPPRCAGLSSSWLNTPRSKVDQNISFPSLQNVKMTYL